MNIEDSLKWRRVGAHTCGIGVSTGKGAGPPFYLGMSPDDSASALSRDVSGRGESHFLFLKSQQHGASPSAKSEAHGHRKPNTWVPKLHRCVCTLLGTPLVLTLKRCEIAGKENLPPTDTHTRHSHWPNSAWLSFLQEKP